MNYTVDLSERSNPGLHDREITFEIDGYEDRIKAARVVLRENPGFHLIEIALAPREGWKAAFIIVSQLDERLLFVRAWSNADREFLGLFEAGI